MKSTFISPWTLFVLLLALLFSVWSVALIVIFHQEQQAVRNEATLITKLNRLGATIHELGTGIDKNQPDPTPESPEARWQRLYSNYRAQVVAFDADGTNVKDVRAYLNLIEARVVELDGIRAQIQASPSRGVETSQLENQFREAMKRALEAVDQAVQVERGHLANLSLSLAARWGALKVLAATSVAWAVFVCVLLLTLKQTYLALHESNEKYSGLFQHSNDGIILHNLGGQIMDVNQRALEQFGCARGEMLSVSVRDLHPAAALDAAQAALERVSRDGFGSFEVEFQRMNGDVFPAEVSASMFEITGKKVIQCVIRDITERQQAAEALRLSEERYRALYEDNPSMYFTVDAEGTVLSVNQFGVEQLGYTVEELVGRPVLDVFYEDDKERVLEQLAVCLQHPGQLTHWEFRKIRKDGSQLWVKEVARTVLDDKGHPVVFIVCDDITKRKQAEDALATEKERLAVTLRSIGDGVITTDTEGRIVLINKVAEGLTGWTEEEARGRPLSEVYHIVQESTWERCENSVERVLRTDSVAGLANHTILVARDGTERLIADNGAPIRDKDGRVIGVVLVFRDMTERRLMEEERLKASKLESIGILAGGIAHDFNNILATILGNVSLAKAYTDPGDDMFEVVTEAEKACLRAKDLTQQLLTFSKGGVPIREPASIRELIKESAGFALRGSNVRCEFSFADDLKPVEVDEGQISRVIHNLVINADQAMPGGGIIRVRAENAIVGADEDLPLNPGAYVKIVIEDQGMGIPEEHLSKIFDPYFTTKQKGSGLGLATAYSILKKHDGHITVESEMGAGTTFTLYLPASKVEIVSNPEADETLLMNEGRILLMDDEERIRYIVDRMLRHIGYVVNFAKDGVEAIEVYKQAKEAGQAFDAVIMDLTIPGGMGGKEAIKRLIEVDPQVKAIVSSGYSNDPVMANFKQYGFHGCVAKPYRIQELSQTLSEVINRNGMNYAG